MHNTPTLHKSILYKQYRNKLNKILISAEKAHLNLKEQATIINGIDQNPSFPCPMIQPLLSDCAI